MATVQMWPRSDGSRNAISLGPRSYFGLPGTAVAVASADVPALQSNGWTTYLTIAGKTTITMISDGIHNQFTTEGRTYSTTAGISIEVLPYDAPVGQANGWMVVQYGNTVPINLVPPVIYGTGQVGQVLTVTTGTYLNNSGITFAYQWFRNSTALSGQTGTSYTCVEADVPNSIYVQETPSNPFGSGLPVKNIIPVFGLWESNLNGAAPQLLYQLPTQMMNHASMSPHPVAIGGVAQTYVPVTVYNLPGGNGLSIEQGNYDDTEIRTVRISDGLVESRVPANALYNNSNPHFWPDGQSFVYATSNTPSTHGGMGRYFLSTGINEVFYDPGTFNVADFDVNANGDVVMEGQGTVDSVTTNCLFILHAGVLSAQFTSPAIVGTFNPSGDFDPSWAPNGNYIACTRALTPGIFKIVVIAVGNTGGGAPYANNGETILSPPGSAQAYFGVPRFSFDSTKIITWLIDPANRAANGIYYMNLDGSGLTQVLLPAQFQYNTPNFTPGGGSSGLAPILYSTESLSIFDIAPVNTVLPVITGTAVHGNTLTCSTGTWTGSNLSYKYQWSGSVEGAIAGATHSTYPLVVGDEGNTITCAVMATNSGGSPIATSLPTATIT